MKGHRMYRSAPEEEVIIKQQRLPKNLRPKPEKPAGESKLARKLRRRRERRGTA